MMEEDSDTSLLSLVLVAVIVSGLFYVARRFFKGPQFTENVKPRGKIAVVTGANSGIGKQLTRELNIRGAKVYMMCRNLDRGRSAVKDLCVKYGCDATRLVVLQGDLADLSSIRQFAEEFNAREERLDFLINNAGMMFYPKFELTKDGHELTWQSNYLGHFLLTELLMPKMEEAEAARIVNVSSLMHLYADNVRQETVEDKKKYNRFTKTYARSKVAQVMHAVTLTKRMRARDPTTKITINACHPGTVDTNLVHNTPLSFPIIAAIAKPFIWFFMKTDQDGAQTPLFLALSKKIDGVSGKYFSDCKEAKTNSLVDDQDACNELYNYSLVACGLNK